MSASNETLFFLTHFPALESAPPRYYIDRIMESSHSAWLLSISLILPNKLSSTARDVFESC